MESCIERVNISAFNRPKSKSWCIRINDPMHLWGFNDGALMHISARRTMRHAIVFARSHHQPHTISGRAGWTLPKSAVFEFRAAR